MHARMFLNVHPCVFTAHRIQADVLVYAYAVGALINRTGTGLLYSTTIIRTRQELCW